MFSRYSLLRILNFKNSEASCTCASQDENILEVSNETLMRKIRKV